MDFNVVNENLLQMNVKVLENENYPITLNFHS